MLRNDSSHNILKMFKFAMLLKKQTNKNLKKTTSRQ